MAIVIFALLGVALGSFINALVWRLHNREQESESREQKGKNPTSEFRPPTSVLSGRSVCVHCGHMLAAKDLVPVLSWLILRGRCRYCHKPIPLQYPLVELMTGLLFLWSYAAWPYGLETGLEWLRFGMWLVYLVILVALTVYDLRCQMLPNRLVFPLISLVAGETFLRAAISHDSLAILKDAVLGLVVAGGFFYGLFVASKGRWIGGGDVKYSFFMGLLLGPWRSVVALYLAFNTAALVILPFFVAKKVTKKSQIPFGPFLILATVISQFYGERLIEWYKNLFLAP